MRIILDENVPAVLAEWMLGHEVVTVQGAGWSGLTNGDLLDRIGSTFDLFIPQTKTCGISKMFQLAGLLFWSFRQIDCRS